MIAALEDAFEISLLPLCASTEIVFVRFAWLRTLTASPERFEQGVVPHSPENSDGFRTSIEPVEDAKFANRIEPCELIKLAFKRLSTFASASAFPVWMFCVEDAIGGVEVVAEVLAVPAFPTDTGISVVAADDVAWLAGEEDAVMPSSAVEEAALDSGEETVEEPTSSDGFVELAWSDRLFVDVAACCAVVVATSVVSAEEDAADISVVVALCASDWLIAALVVAALSATTRSGAN